VKPLGREVSSSKASRTHVVPACWPSAVVVCAPSCVKLGDRAPTSVGLGGCDLAIVGQGGRRGRQPELCREGGSTGGVSTKGRGAQWVEACSAVGK
jgi:hypothetical protein